ncbi:MAG: hypothetical protein OHK0029_03820 [Armatimonadaceae bacterium]
MRQRDFVVFALLVTLFATVDFTNGASAQQSREPKYATVSARVTPATVAPGEKAMLTVTVQVKEGFHINAEKPGDENLIPTVLTVSKPMLGGATPKPAGISVGKSAFPKPKSMPSLMGEGEMFVYEGKVEITAPVTVAKNAAPGMAAIRGTLRTQGCNETMCFPPATFPFEAPVTIRKK